LTNRWFQLLAGIVGMIAVTNLQYGWTFFVEPMAKKHLWDRLEIQVAFNIFVLTETWLVPIEAYLADRFGTRLLVVAGAVLVAAAWTINAAADSLLWLYVGNGIGGAGAGIVYGISIGNALRWFPDRRGLAAGLTAAAFGAGSAITVIPIQETIQRAGYEAAFLWFGLAQGGVVLLVALVMRTPHLSPVAAQPSARGVQMHREFTPLEMLRAPIFWFLYVLMTLITGGGLVAIAQLGPIAKDFGVADVPIAMMTYSISALSLAALLERIGSGLTRPFFGWISDFIGREKTMFIAFSLEAVSLWCWMSLGETPELFVLFAGLTLFFWGEVFSLFPALCGDMFGRRYATTNYAILYTAKGTAASMVPLGSYLYETTGSWTPIFTLAIVFDVVVAISVLFVLRPWRARWSNELQGKSQ
jgi:OFA family oxalate/formate antiporter-like MFS transporter